MTLHCMIDLETMSTLPTATILTLGAVLFDPYKSTIENTLYLKIDTHEQELMKRHIDDKTLDWWSRQDAEVMLEAFSDSGRVSVNEAIKQLTNFSKPASCFWSHGSIFDIIILDNIYSQINKSPPWKFWQVRDTRTLFDLGIDPNMSRSGLHNALEDAKRQACGVQNVYRQLEKLKNTKENILLQE